MASNTQDLNNAVAFIMPVTDQEKAATSRGSPDLFEEEEEVRVVKKVCQRPAARLGLIEKYRITCNKTNPYAGSWPTARKSLIPSTSPAAAPAVETPRVPSPECVVLTPLSPLPSTPVNPQALVPQVRQPIVEVREEMEPFLQRCREVELASRSSVAELASTFCQQSEIASQRSKLEKQIAELTKDLAELHRKETSLEERRKVQHVTGSDKGHPSDGKYPDPDGWWDPDWDDPLPGGTDDDDDSDDDDDADDESEEFEDKPQPSPILIEDSPPPSLTRHQSQFYIILPQCRVQDPSRYMK
nr:uncharacterized protein LOC111507450 [Leptinotarsa decemlineata]